MKLESKKSTGIKNILIAEDSLTQATQIKHLLESRHYKVTVAKDGRQAMDRILKHKPSLIISDILMPHINGYQLCKNIKSNRDTKDIPVILLTRLYDPEEIIEGLSCGADGFITKPYNDKYLLSHIGKFLTEENDGGLKKVPFATQIYYKGRKRIIQAEQQNVIRLMLDIYEGAIEQNERLIQTQEEVRLFNERLESIVENRTSDLTAEIKLSNRIAARLKESEEKFRSIMENSPDAIFIVDQKGRYKYTNKKVTEMLGYSSEEMLDKTIEDLSPANKKDEYFGIFNRILAEGRAFAEIEHLRKDGTPISNDLNAILLPDGFVYGSCRDITARKKAEETILNLAKFPSQNPDPVLRIDNAGKLLYANEASYKNLDWSLKIGEIAPQELQKVTAAALEQADGTLIEIQNGNRIFSFIVTPVTESGYANLYGRDVTRRKQMEDSLQKSQLRFKQISENSGEWIWEIDVNGIYTYSNPIIKEILGYEPEEIINRKHFYDFFILKERDQLKQTAFDVFSQKISFRNFINTNIHKNGQEVILSTSGIPIIDDAGNLIGYRGVDMDITERKRMQEKLEFKNIILNTQQETSIDGILVVDEKGDILNSNSRFAEIFNIPSKIIESGSDKLFQEWAMKETKNPDEFINRIKYINDFRDEICIDEVAFINGRLIERYSAPLTGQDSKYYGRVWYFRDITERKKAEESLIMAKNKAEESDRLKTAFLHNISHEIRTPMNAIVGFSNILREPGIDSKTQQSYIETIIQSSNHLLAIISDIVDFSNIEAHLIKRVNNAININLTLNSICTQFLPKAGEKKIRLHFESELSGPDALIVTDSTKLTQILSNLINNALKFTDEGSVLVRCRKTDSFLEFAVSDTGIGISSEYTEKIFDRFYQVQNSVSKLYEGTGLGLAISKAYVELLGGKIWLSSEIGKGTTFFFTILYQKQVTESTAIHKKEVLERHFFPEKKTILVVEDIESNFKLIDYYLSETNLTLIRASNGKEAVEMAMSNKNIDLILMDIKMPLMDGYSATKLIREAKITTPVIAQTGYSDDREKAMESGFNAFISKPFDKNALIKIIKECI